MTTETGLLEALFRDRFGNAPERVEALPLSGSDRRYYRLEGGGERAIGTLSTAVRENEAFFYFTGLFRAHGVPVPEIYGIAAPRTAYLQQDLGGTALFDRLQAEGHTPEVYTLFQKSLGALARAQWAAGRAADFSKCHAARAFDAARIADDLRYFRQQFLDRLSISYNRAAVEADMQALSATLAHTQPQTLMYRDFQSRNVLVDAEDRVWLIDYQGAMQGPPGYDLASFLWQARAALPDAWKEGLFAHYLQTLRKEALADVEEDAFRNTYTQLVLLRLLQVLGAYGARGLGEGKPHFLSSIAPAVRSLRLFLSAHPHVPHLPALRALLEEVSGSAVEARFAAANPS